MGRRKTYSKLRKTGQNRPKHVKGQVVYKGFQCLNPDCREFLFIKKNNLPDENIFDCEACGFTFDPAEGSTRFFDYALVHIDTKEVVEEGVFDVSHSEYIDEAQEYKHCLYCCTMKPLEMFDRHSSLGSGRQGECNLCKTKYNAIKNQSRLTDQHREAAQRRRLFRMLGDDTSGIDSARVHEKFGGKCFNCNTELDLESRDCQIDHTLPVRLLWPTSTETATLLCRKCNGNKAAQWPGEFYTRRQLKALSRLTGYEYQLLDGPPLLNQEAIDSITADADSFIEEWIDRPDELRSLRRLILEEAKIDIFAAADHVPPFLRE